MVSDNNSLIKIIDEEDIIQEYIIQIYNSLDNNNDCNEILRYTENESLNQMNQTNNYLKG